MDDRIRTSDADRDRVTARLREHFAEGRLTREELDERISAALSAKTFGELRQVMTDLPEPGVTPRLFTREPGQVPGQVAALRPTRPARLRRGPRLFPLLLLALLLLVVIPGSGAAVIALKVLAVIAALMVAACAVAMFVAARFIRRMRRNWYWSTYQQVQDHFHHHGWAWSWPDSFGPNTRSSRP